MGFWLSSKGGLPTGTKGMGAIAPIRCLQDCLELRNGTWHHLRATSLLLSNSDTCILEIQCESGAGHGDLFTLPS